MKPSKILRLLAGLVILLLLIYKVGISNLIETLKEFNLYYILPILIVFFITLFFGALNIKILLDPYKKLRFISVFKYYLLSWSVGLLLPGKVGDLSLTYFLKKENIDYGKGLAISLVDKLITLVVLIFLSVLGFFIFFDPLEAVLLTALSFAVLVLFVFLISSSFIRNLVKKYILRKHSKHFKGFSIIFKDYLLNKKQILLVNTLFTFLKNIFLGVSIVLYFFAFSQYISPVSIILINSMITLIGSIPTTINGIGVKHAFGLYLFDKIGIDFSIALSAMLLILVVNYLTAFFIFLFIKPKN